MQEETHKCWKLAYKTGIKMSTFNGITKLGERHFENKYLVNYLQLLGI